MFVASHTSPSRFAHIVLFFAVVCLYGCSTAVLADKNQQNNDWLVRMSRAFAEQDYQGVFVYAHGNAMDTLRIIHRADGESERERIVRLDGPHQEIIRHGSKVICVHGANWNGNINHHIPLGPFAKAFVRDMSELGDSYTLVKKGQARVAGRDTISLWIKPRDDYRYGYRVWLDKETGLLLKSVLLYHGKVLERFQFTQFELSDHITDAELEVGITGATTVHYPWLVEEPDPVDHASSAWKLNWLPAGFSMSMEGFRHQHDGSAADTLTFTDGMSAFSIFIEKAVDAQYQEVTAQKGATVAITRIVSYPMGEHIVTVVGEVPMKTAKRIALSVVPVAVAAITPK